MRDGRECERSDCALLEMVGGYVLLVLVKQGMTRYRYLWACDWRPQKH